MKRLVPYLSALAGLFLLALVIGTSTTGCGTTDNWQPPRELSSTEANLVESSNGFGFTFFNELIAQSDGGNLFVSPLSVSMALGMVYNGARGGTEQGMRQCLQFGNLTLEEINQGYKGLIELLSGMDPDVKMEIANSIWYREGFEVLQDFIDANVTFFGAVVSALDFSDSGAADTINAWVSEKTHGKIDKIVDSPIDSALVMFLINAVYFKGSWVSQFDPAETQDAVFHAPDGDKNVKMMHIEDKLRILNNDDFQAVDLPYGHGLFSMTIILPHPDKDIDQVAAGLNAASFADALEQFQERENYQFYMPRYELKYEKTLNDVLIALGMGEAFDEVKADLTGINPAGGLFISFVKHKSYVKVNEEGTEAAAVTSVGVGTSSMPEEMRVDRPFLFIIHDSHSHALIFMGKIVDPPSE
jgi:serine protease inhibitor